MPIRAVPDALEVGVQLRLHLGLIELAVNDVIVAIVTGAVREFLISRRVHPAEIEFRQSPGNSGSDTWTYAALLRSEWSEAESVDRVAIRHFFIPLK